MCIITLLSDEKSYEMDLTPFLFVYLFVLNTQLCSLVYYNR